MTLYHVALLVDLHRNAERNDSAANDFLHCLAERPRGDLVHLDQHLHLE